MNGYYIFLSEGYEPLEALGPMDVLRRAKVDAKFVSTGDSLFNASTQGYSIQADMTWEEFTAGVDMSGYDGCMIFPGGLPGADNLGENHALTSILRDHFSNGGLTAAICAAPARVLARNLIGLLDGKKMTVYEGFESELVSAGAVPTGAGVQEDGNLITAKGPGLAIEFGFSILSRLVDRRVWNVVRHAMMIED